MAFPDGTLPSKEDIKKWSKIVDEFFSDSGPHGSEVAEQD